MDMVNLQVYVPFPSDVKISFNIYCNSGLLETSWCLEVEGKSPALSMEVATESWVLDLQNSWIWGQETLTAAAKYVCENRQGCNAGEWPALWLLLNDEVWKDTSLGY
ncbi:uncharacterized protein LOC144291661 [Canis aureus]